MSYTAPTSWNSHGINWTADPFNLPLNLSVIESLRIALNERRFKVTGASAITANVVHGQPDLGIYGNIHDFALRFHYYRDALIGVYVDHHDEANWDNSDDGPKVWTKADLFTYLGETEIVPASGSPLDGAWVRQQYLVLNQLRWTINLPPQQAWGGGLNNSPPSGGGWFLGDSSEEEARWSDARHAAATDYTSIGAPGSNYAAQRYSNGRQSAESPDEFGATLRSVKNTFRVSISREFESDVDFYCYPDKPVITGVDSGDVEGDLFGDLSYFQKWNYIGTETSTKNPGGDLYAWSPFVGNLTVPPWPVAAPTFGTPVARGWSLFEGGGSIMAVAKWDQNATNGFQFID